MKSAARQGSNDRTFAIRIIGDPRRLHLQDAEGHAVGDHLPDDPQAGLSPPIR